MSLRKETPCDWMDECPYNAEYSDDCEYWCGEEEPEENSDVDYYDDCDYEVGFDPYLGCFTDDC